MFKATPNPPESVTDSLSALKAAKTPRKPSTMFMVAPDIDTESLLGNACESLACASVMLSDFADLLEGPHRNKVLGIAQVVMLGELAVNRALDNIDPHE
ncbi:DUF6124 family protein [Pseudomonas sp. IT-P294]|uniref:DUF6124 family protein n=1 Tax=Pseudomonas sp. IT-P294 TaxID=3026454 RepID=UPI0039E0437E